ncbi:MAG: GNAT family N-acetyltransferase [Gemmatimonadaceae bacterium]
MNVTFARVRASEAARLSEFARDNFDKTYGPLCRAADVDAYMASALTATELLRVLTNPTSWVFAAVVDGEWVGYAQVCLAPLPDGIASKHAPALSTTPMELCRFYVARKCHGTGVAKQMLGIVLAHAELQGSETLWLSVWQENARAIGFYTKWGFATIGEAKFLMGEDLQDDFIMERAVQSPALQSE